MGILIDKTKKVIVQGITGSEGRIRTRLMKEYGTNIVAGCTPGKGGQEVEGVPVFDTLEEAKENVGQINISVIFIPGHLVKEAVLEAIDADIKFLVLVPDRVPLYDVLEIDKYAKEKGIKYLGPNTLGMLVPDEGVLGMIGGSAKTAKSWFFKGPVGVSSRSGGITSSIGYYLCKEGIGVSALVHVGGDPIVGLPHQEIVKLFQDDDETKAIVIFGEIGTSQEEEVAELIEKGIITKPVIAYIGGSQASKGTRFSHAGAIVEGEYGSYEGKIKKLRSSGAIVVENFSDIPKVVKKILYVTSFI